MTRFVFLLICLMVLPLTAWAELRIDITQGRVEPLPIAVPDFYVTGGDTSVGTGISDVIAANLERSGLFRVIDKAAYIQKPEALQLQPRFADWRIIDTEALVAGRVATEMDGRLRVEFRLWDALAGRQMTGLAYLTTNENWRRIAHIISDAIYKRLTGEDGYFDTRIVYVSEDGPGNARVKRLAIMDQDGANHRFLTKGDHLVLTPRFSPTGPEITYLAYYNDKPRVYLQNIDTGKIEVLGDFSGMTFAPRFSPDGDKVVMSLEAGGNSDIYTMDLRTRRVEQLTDHLAIDTSPSYAPDGKRIVFESDRGGTQQLYVASSEGGRPERITFGQGRYGNPVWSPRGDLIAFTKMWGGNFFIGVIRPDGTGERLLVQAYHVEGPSWAPNGRVLMYFKESPTGPRGRSRKAKLWSIDITGYNEQEVATPLDASDPAWSPLIQ